jgi:glycosyltransferase involved in cell wall biosynthesis
MGLTIAQVSNSCSRNGGVGTYVLNLCRALGNAGHRVFVVHADPTVSSPPPGAHDHFFVEEFDHFSDEDRSRSTARSVMHVLQRLRPDVVHIQSNNNFVLEADIREQFPSIKSLHLYDFCPSETKFHHASGVTCQHATGPLCIARLGYKRCMLTKRPSIMWSHYRRAVAANQNNAHYNKLIVGSEFVKKQAIASGYPASQITVVPYFTRLPGDSRQAKEDNKTVLFTGRVAREKGLGKLLEAMALIRSDWNLIVDGDGPDLNRTKQIARRLGLSNRTDFVGWAAEDQHLELFRKASVVAVPSVWPEPFGMVGIEAMSHAKPVVAFNVGGITQWLEDGHTGFAVTPYDLKGMSERIGYLLQNEPIAKEMGLNGRRRVEQEFSADKHVNKLLELYREVRNVRTQSKASSS